MQAGALEIPRELISLLSGTLQRGSAKLVALTGAGVSQESGLRTFRDAQTGLWAQYKPEELASPQAFARDPKLIWDWYAWRREAVKGVRPNPGHYALVEMEKRAPGFTLITQNVDGLHRMAGNQHVLELHGNIQRVRCADCHTVTETWRMILIPLPPDLWRLASTDVVWFGESLPRDQLEAAVEAARSCDIFFSIGTSGVVQPAASLAFAAHNRGAVVVEVNAEPTPLTLKANFALHGKSGEILPRLVEAVWG
jgi:NAD-dependent deacetylase